MLFLDSQNTLNKAEKILLVLILVIAPLFAFYDISRSLWLDEVYSYYVANGSFAQIIEKLKLGAGPPLYYFILSIWTKIFGTTELAFRSLSSLFYLLSIPSIYYLGKILYKESKISLLSTLLFVVSPIAYGHAQNTRMYSMLAFMVIISSLFFFNLLLNNPHSKRDLFLLIISNIIGTFTHFWYFFIISGQFLTYFIFHKKETKKVFFALIASVLPFWILWTPIFILQMRPENKAGDWIKTPTIYSLIETVIGFYDTDNWQYIIATNEITWYKGIIFYFLLVLLVMFKFSEGKLKLNAFKEIKEKFLDKKSIALFIIFYLGLFIPFMISQVKPLYFPHRYTIIALPPFIMFCSGIVGHFSNRLILNIFCYLLLLFSTFTFVKDAFIPKQEAGDKFVAKVLITNAKPNDLIIFTGLSRLPIEFYLNTPNTNNTATKISFPLEMDAHPAWINMDWRDTSKIEQNIPLNTEARELCLKLLTLSKKDSNVFLISDSNTYLGDMMEFYLKQYFTQVKAVDIVTFNCKKITIYEAKKNNN